ncbi:MAG: prepilin-type N-terminal cleavage/methylation domain-containing protein [Acetobacteraceae bacterium]|nr:prepilin-type N-terminal cleavage/methylation domain-containing protein [Acetobacteraceae bacterium]
MNTGRTAGFTLLEILVALVVLGFLMVGLSQGVRFGLTAWGMQERLINQRGDLDAVDRALRQLVTRMDPGTRADPPQVAGTQAEFGFTAALPLAADGGSADMLLAVDPAHRFVLRWLPHLHARRTAPPPPPRVETLLEGVARVQFAYWRPAAGGGGWVGAWDGKSLPALVRFRIVFPEGDRRHWPDIVAAPLRAGPDR